MDDPLANFLPGSPSPFRRFAMSVGVCFVCLWRDRNNGFDVLKQIRSVDPRAQVMILTGTGTSTEEQRARELGVTDFLQKGFSLQALGAAMDRVLSYVGSPTDSIATKPTEEPRRMEDRRKFPRFW